MTMRDAESQLSLKFKWHSCNQPKSQ